VIDLAEFQGGENEQEIITDFSQLHHRSSIGCGGIDNAG
jgi:hypothetical protein